jgi:hypothetical protein
LFFFQGLYIIDISSEKRTHPNIVDGVIIKNESLYYIINVY